MLELDDLHNLSVHIEGYAVSEIADRNHLIILLKRARQRAKCVHNSTYVF